MSTGFRKSFFGFQKDDVLSYIQTLHDEAAKREKELTDALHKEKATAASLEEKLAVSDETARKLSEQLAVFEQQKNELNQMSETIGRLYLVAKSSAALLMKNAEDNRATVEARIRENLEAIESVRLSLEEAKGRMDETARRYTQEVDELSCSLDKAKQTLADREAQSDQAVAEYQSVAQHQATIHA